MYKLFIPRQSECCSRGSETARKCLKTSTQTLLTLLMKQQTIKFQSIIWPFIKHGAKTVAALLFSGLHFTQCGSMIVEWNISSSITWTGTLFPTEMCGSGRTLMIIIMARWSKLTKRGQSSKYQGCSSKVSWSSGINSHHLHPTWNVFWCNSLLGKMKTEWVGGTMLEVR